MKYFCVDKGTDRCPCSLMEAGQCYVCDMIKGGKCNCQSQWQGICPYTEYVQNEKKILRKSQNRRFRISEIESYSPTLTVIRIEVPIGFGVKCKEIGTFLMVRWKEWFVPISVLCVDVQYSEQVAYIRMGINATGPKTIGLLSYCMIGDELEIRGPYYSGIINSHKYNEKALNMVVAKGIGVMPVINIKEKIGSNLASFKLDVRKLPDRFLKDYLGDIDYEEIDMEENLPAVIDCIKEDYENATHWTGTAPNLFLMVSPYFKEKIVEKMVTEDNHILMLNHSNMCCGEGVCGSCSFSDKDGVTVKRCKCFD